jgi:hypothetical protein
MHRTYPPLQTVATSTLQVCLRSHTTVPTPSSTLVNVSPVAGAGGGGHENEEKNIKKIEAKLNFLSNIT